MKHALVFVFLFLTACAPVQVAVPPDTAIPPTAVPATSVPPTEIFTPIPAATATSGTSSASYIDLDNDGKTVAHDFTQHLCEAAWMNGAVKDLPCPGDLNELTQGYTGLLSGSDQGLDPGFAMILNYPAGYGSGDGSGAIFGRFPKFTVGPNDEFRTSLACRNGADCFVNFTLGYYDANGKYQEPFPTEHYKYGVEPPLNYVWSLSSLAGQTVEFVLAVRNEGTQSQAWALWIYPRILR